MHILRHDAPGTNGIKFFSLLCPHLEFIQKFKNNLSIYIKQWTRIFKDKNEKQNKTKKHPINYFMNSSWIN